MINGEDNAPIVNLLHSGQKQSSLHSDHHTARHQEYRFAVRCPIGDRHLAQ